MKRTIFILVILLLLPIRWSIGQSSGHGVYWGGVNANKNFGPCSEIPTKDYVDSLIRELRQYFISNLNDHKWWITDSICHTQTTEVELVNTYDQPSYVILPYIIGKVTWEEDIRDNLQSQYEIYRIDTTCIYDTIWVQVFYREESKDD